MIHSDVIKSLILEERFITNFHTRIIAFFEETRDSHESSSLWYETFRSSLLALEKVKFLEGEFSRCKHFGNEKYLISQFPDNYYDWSDPLNDFLILETLFKNVYFFFFYDLQVAGQRPRFERWSSLPGWVFLFVIIPSPCPSALYQPSTDISSISPKIANSLKKQRNFYFFKWKWLNKSFQKDDKNVENYEFYRSIFFLTNNSVATIDQSLILKNQPEIFSAIHSR